MSLAESRFTQAQTKKRDTRGGGLLSYRGKEENCAREGRKGKGRGEG